MNRAVLIFLFIGMLVSSCEPATTATQPVVDSSPEEPSQARDQVNVIHETILYAGPSNISFQILSKLQPGDILFPLGSYFDFIKVETSEGLSGFVVKTSLDNIPPDLPKLGTNEVPWIYYNAIENFVSEATTFENENILIRDINNTGTNIEGGSRHLDSAFRIRTALSLKDTGTGYANVQLIGTPAIIQENWWQEYIRMDVGVNTQGNLQICLRDGTSQNCAFEKALSMRADEPFSIVFDDPQGKTFHILDQQGIETLMIRVTNQKGVNLPNGLFPDQKVWLGAWVGEQTSLLVSSFTFERAPSGKWDTVVGDAVHLDLNPVIDIEEEFIEVVDPENGARPLWSRGSSVIARQGEDVFVSMIEKQGGWAVPNNVKCVIYKRTNTGWQMERLFDEATREPCPIGIDDKNLYVSTNPSLGELSQPAVVTLDKSNLDNKLDTLLPEWDEDHHFTAWSYRGFGVDNVNHELLLLNISDYKAQYWSYLNGTGQWSRKGSLLFPYSQEFSTPLRLAYPNVAIQNRSAYIMAISDILEPKSELKDYMLQHSGDFVYVFRQIYYSWNPDITTQPFSEWLPLASVEPYGQITNDDLWIAPDGTAHFLWLEQAVDNRLSEFLPEIPDTQTLWHAVIKDGKIVSRDILIDYDTRGIRPNDARFHATADGRLFVIFSCYELDHQIGNRLLEIYPDGTHSESVKLNLKTPLEVFTNAGQRNGSLPSPYLDILGAPHWDGDLLNYVRIKLE